MDENMTASKSTISEEQGTEAASDAETAPQETEGQTEPNASGAESGAAAAEEEPFLEIKYNHEKKGLTREEAAALAQKGMRYEGAYKALQRNAALEGKTVDEYLKSLEEARDKAYRESLSERFGEDEETINQMMELYSINKQKTLDKAEKAAIDAAKLEEQNLNARIADEFVAMKADFPELTEFSALPAAVKQAAAEGMPLPYAYLQFKHREAKKAEAAKLAEQEAAKKTTGSVKANDTEGKTDEERRYLNALWGR